MFGITSRRKKLSNADREWTKRTADELEAALQEDLRRELKVDEQKLTTSEREQIAKAERVATFKAAYIKRSDAALDTRNAVSIARTNLITLMIIITLPLATVTYIFYQQRNERIDCGELSRSSVNYLKDSGESLPSSCIVAY
jgi:hypothetical protein